MATDQDLRAVLLLLAENAPVTPGNASEDEAVSRHPQRNSWLMPVLVAVVVGVLIVGSVLLIQRRHSADDRVPAAVSPSMTVQPEATGDPDNAAAMSLSDEFTSAVPTDIKSDIVGVIVAPHAGLEVVWSGSSVTRLQAVADSLPPHPGKITFTHVPYPLATLMAVTNRISADLASLKDHGVDVTGWGPDARTDKVVVYLSAYTAEAARFMADRYGALVTVSTTARGRVP